MKTYLVLLMLFVSGYSISQEVLPANMKTLDSLKKANEGKVVMINLWATWCKPCVEEFPDILKLNSEYKDNDFKLILVSLDFGEDLQTQTKSFLKKNDVDFVTYYNNFSKDDELIDYMDKSWNGGIPGTFIYDKNGVLKKSLIGKTKYKDFKKEVNKLL